MSSRRILVVSQDDFFEGSDLEAENLTVDLLRTRRRSITPGASLFPALTLIQMLKICSRMITGGYSAYFLPGFRLDFSHNESRRQGALRWLLNRRWISTITRPILENKLVVIHNRDDTAVIQESLAKIFWADAYLKSNLYLADYDPPAVDYLPYWILRDQAERISSRRPAKDIDIFYAGWIGGRRKELLEPLLAELENRSLDVVVQRKKLSLNGYYEMLARSRLVISPEGVGWHCFRHYEALAARAIPVINRSDPPIVSNLVDGHNAIIYDDPVTGAERIQTFLRERPDSFLSPEEMESFVFSNCTENAVSHLLLRYLKEDPARENQMLNCPNPNELP